MTENIAPKEELQQNDSSQVMPGNLLKDGRERAKLSTEDVASKLNLKHSFVVQIEANNFDQLPGPTFIRGYLRAYSKLIDMDAEPVISAFNALSGDGQADSRNTRSHRPVETIRPQRNLSDPLIKYTTLIVLAAIIALSVIWWQSRNGGELNLMNFGQSDTVAVEKSNGETVLAPMNIPDSQDSDDTLDEVSELTPEELQATAESEEGFSELSSDADAAQDNAVEENSDQVSADTERAEQDSVSASGAAGTTDSTEQRADTAEVTPAETASESSSSEPVGSETDAVETTAAVLPEPALPLAEGLSRLVINYDEECWVTVTDARGLKVINNLKKPGEVSDVTGVAPFKMMIGNATGASVVYNGQSVDLKPHTNRNNIARFTLGEQE